MHILYCLLDRPFLCGNFIEFDEQKCLYSKSFRFYKHFDLSETKHGMPCTSKNICCQTSIITQCRQNSEVHNKTIFRDRGASFVNCVTETPLLRISNIMLTLLCPFPMRFSHNRRYVTGKMHIKFAYKPSFSVFRWLVFCSKVPICYSRNVYINI